MSKHETDTKSMTLRLDHGLAERVQAIADVEGRSVSDVVRNAIVEHVERRRKDETFQQLLQANMARHARLLKMLADG